MDRNIRIFIIDDSAVARKVFARDLSKERGIEVIGTAPDPYVARDKIVQLQSDVITLDVEMPLMDALTFLKKLIKHYPLPVIIVIVQHMPAQFTISFAERLDCLCQIRVKEAANGDSVVNGTALLAPGNNCMLLRRCGARCRVEIKTGPMVHHQRPVVGVMFRSISKNAGANAVGILLTGMGADGAAGLLEMNTAGAKTIAQDEKAVWFSECPKKPSNAAPPTGLWPSMTSPRWRCR